MLEDKVPDLFNDLTAFLRPEHSAKGEKIGRYVKERRIGSGGMGEVWKALDEELNRVVALKFLKYTDAEELARFRREARTAGKLKHPNIGAIFDFGEHNGLPFIAMEYIDGETLHTVPRDDRRKLVAYIRDAAQAVHHAHDQKIIHRDIKPANLMVDKSGRLFVLDFGLAKQTSVDSSISMTGLILGTPMYMSPEQAEGKSDIDERTDVYSLGATLYELLCDRPPFTGKIPKLLARVIEEDAKPLRKRNSRIDRDLETIVTKCLEKDPARRYATAADLADDLTRYLNGEAISAHPPSAFYILKKHLARRKAISITVAAAVAALTTAAIILSMKEGELTDARDLALRQMRETTQAYLDAALGLRRAGDLEGMQKYAGRTETACAEVIRQFPDDPEPHFRLGRIYRALMRFEDAMKEQDAALARDPDYPPALLERGLLRHRIYRAELEKATGDFWRQRAESIGGLRGVIVSAAEPGSSKETERRRKEALDDLRKVDNLLARGFCAEMVEDDEVAIRHLTLAVEEDSRQDEAYIWLGLLHTRNDQFEKALLWLTRGVERDRGYAPLLAARAKAHTNLAGALGFKDKKAADHFQLGIDDYRNVLKLDPGNREYLKSLGFALFSQGWYRQETAGDARTSYRESIDVCTRGLRDNPEDSEFYWYRARSRTNLANYVRSHGGTPDPFFELARADLDRSIELNDQDCDAWISRGTLFINMGNHLRSFGKSPVEYFDLALDSLNQATKLAPEIGVSWIRRGDLRLNYGGWEQQNGRSPNFHYDQGVKDFTEADRLSPDSGMILMKRGVLHTNIAMYRQNSGKDPTRAYDRARADLDKCVGLNPGQDEAWFRRGVLYLNLGVFVASKRKDPVPTFEKGLKSLDQAIALNPDRAESWQSRGSIRSTLLIHYMSQGKASQGVEVYKELVADYNEAVRLNPKDADSYHRRGISHMLMNENQKALDDFEKAVELRPTMEKRLKMFIDMVKKRLGR